MKDKHHTLTKEDRDSLETAISIIRNLPFNVDISNAGIFSEVQVQFFDFDLFAKEFPEAKCKEGKSEPCMFYETTRDGTEYTIVCINEEEEKN